MAIKAIFFFAVVSLLLFTSSGSTISKLSNVSTISLNIGPKLAISGTKSFSNLKKLSSPYFTSGFEPLPPDDPLFSTEVFKTFRQGISFKLTLPAVSGAYNLFLGFTPPKVCTKGANVFHVYLGDVLILPSYDIVENAPTCTTPIIEMFSWIKINSHASSRTLSFQAVSGVASISSVIISVPKEKCDRVDKSISSTHLAHAKPGQYPLGGGSYVDRMGRGFRTVYLNGYDSHSHFIIKGKAAKIRSYTWTLYPSGRVISRRGGFSYNFSLGTTDLSLMVVDTSCFKHSAITHVSISAIVQPGAYCYLYWPMKETPIAGTLGDFPKPVYATIDAKTPGPSMFSFNGMGRHEILNKLFVARCTFLIKSSKSASDTVFGISTGRTGVAKLYIDNGLVLDTSNYFSSGPLQVSAGLTSFELIYRRTTTKLPPALKIKQNNLYPKVLHDNSAIQPIISSISPSAASFKGGNEVMISGYGLSLNGKFFFGKVAVRPDWYGATSTRLFVHTPKISLPASTSEKVINLAIENKPGIRSNSEQFKFTSRCDALSFTKRHLQMSKSGNHVPIRSATSVALGNDGRLYIGTVEGIVHSLTYDPLSLKVLSMCSSPVLRDSKYKWKDGTFSVRSVLGIVIDPRDKIPRPYVSVSTLMWSFKVDIKNKFRWSNGKVHRLLLMPNTNGICLKWDKTIISNLPVSPRDHAVNEMIFTQNGDLLISIGGYTNAGLPSEETGGFWETYFSGSVIIARLSRGSKFNGHIPYLNPENPRTAIPPKSYTDIELYATGLRNLFSLTMTRDGKIFGVDMGTNCGQGDVSSSCREYVERATSGKTGNYNQRGSVVVDSNSKQCKYGPSRLDKIVQLKAGKFYGHSNLQRGTLTKRDSECRWVDPIVNLPPGGKHSAPTNYEAPIALIYSAKTGVVEYGSKLFCNELRGDLMFSQYSERGTWRLRFGDKKEIIEEPFHFIRGYSGIRVIENVHGDLLFPRYKHQGIFVSKAKISKKNGLFVGNALPFRHGRYGGTRITIGGWGFKVGVKVFVGKNACKVEKVWELEIVCVVPKNTANRHLVDIKVVTRSESSILDKAVLYMSV